MSDAAIDVELLRRWQSGDRGAAERLVIRHFSTVFGFFMRRLGHEDAARDLTQHAFLQLVEGQHRIVDPTRFRAYLLGTARHVLLGHLRSSARETANMRRFGAGPPSVLSPTALLAASEEQRLLAASLPRLSVDEQLVLELHYWERMSSAEIAQVLEIQPSTVRWRLMKAREQLRAVMSEVASSPELAVAVSRDLDRWAASLQQRQADSDHGA